MMILCLSGIPQPPENILELVETPDHIRGTGENAIRVFAIHVALWRTGI
jgi:hypothetical protein